MNSRTIKTNFNSLLIGLGLFLILVWFFGFRQGILLLIGIGYGLCLSIGKFGFTTGWRVLILNGDTKGIKAQFLLIIVLCLLCLALINLYPYFELMEAPISYSFIIGAFVFGVFMQLADGCGSGTLYKAGSLKTYNVLILPFFILGSFGATLHIDKWINLGQVLPAINLINTFSAMGYFILVLALLYILFVLIKIHPLVKANQSSVSNWQGNKIYIIALILALLAAFNYWFVGQPWGIVYGLGLWGAKFFHHLGFDLSVYAFWKVGYNQYALEHSLLLDNTSMTNLGLLFGAFCVHKKDKNQSKKNINHSTELNQNWHQLLNRIAKIAFIGFVLGYSSRLAFGCNIGAMISGITTGSLHGWLWLVFAFLGSYCLLKFRV